MFGIYFTDQNRLELALAKAAKGLVFEFQQRPRLALGERPEDLQRAGQTYVCMGFPDLVLPAGETGEMVDVALDEDVTTFRRIFSPSPSAWNLGTTTFPDDTTLTLKS